MPSARAAIIRDFLQSVTYDPDTGEFRNRHGKVYKLPFFRIQGDYYPMEQAAFYCMTRDLGYIRGMFPHRLTDPLVVHLADRSLPHPQRFALFNLREAGLAHGTTFTFDRDANRWIKSTPVDTGADAPFNQPGANHDL